MREQPHYDSLLTKEFFDKHYIEEKKSMVDLEKMLQRNGFRIVRSTLIKYAKKHNIAIRGCSEARLNWEIDPLDYNKSLPIILEDLDGFLLGDGCLIPNHNTKSGRITWGVQHQEFSNYFINIFKYGKPAHVPAHSKKSNTDFWSGFSKHHPDFYQQYIRWYQIQENGKYLKRPPKDIIISPKSVLLWYLGDGSIVDIAKSNTLLLRLSTDGFLSEDVDFLVNKLNDLGIICKQNGEGRIQVSTKGIPAFFNYIGKESPVECYKYKFEIPEWRFTAKRMRQVSEEFGIDYNQLAYKIKVGALPCYRQSSDGKPWFLPEHVLAAKKKFGIE